LLKLTHAAGPVTLTLCAGGWNALLKEMQADLANRCPNSVQVVVPNSTHTIQLDQPGVVVDAIRRVVTAVREQRPLQASESPAQAGSL